MIDDTIAPLLQGGQLFETGAGGSAPRYVQQLVKKVICADAHYPSQKVNEIDNRGSTYYLALAWAKALAAQDEDGILKRRFTPVAAALAEAEGKITQELLAAQGKPVDMGVLLPGRR